MTAYTVVLQLVAPQPPTQQPGQVTPIIESHSVGFSIQNVNTADKPSALVAAIAAYQTAWASTENARYSGTSAQVLQPGGVPVYTAAMAPAVHSSIVLTGTATYP